MLGIHFNNKIIFFLFFNYFYFFFYRLEMHILILLLGVYPGVVLGLGKDSYSFVLPSPGAINKCVDGNAKSLTKLRHTVLVGN